MSPRDFFGLSLIKKVIYDNEGQYMVSRIILVSCITINIDDTLSDPLNAYKIYGHGYFVFFTRKSSFRLLEILERASRGILVVGLQILFVKIHIVIPFLTLEELLV